MADIASAFASERGDDTGADMLFWIAAARRSIDSHQRDIDVSRRRPRPLLAARLASLAATARAMALEMGYGFLLDPARKLLSIGYRVADGTLDPSCYDLAGVRGAARELHRHRQGRRSGPALVPSRSCRHADRQRRRADFLVGVDVRIPDAVAGHARAGGKPAGADQSADRAAADRLWRVARPAVGRLGIRLQRPRPRADLPILELRRSRPRPEARPGRERRGRARTRRRLPAWSIPRRRLATSRGSLASAHRGRYGFYEALDYTPSRLPENASVAIVRAFMAHHQGMTIVAIADALLDGAMRARFHAEPMVQATELLLQEGTPRDVAVVRPWAAEAKSDARALQSGSATQAAGDWRPHTPLPSPRTCCPTAATR